MNRKVSEVIVIREIIRQRRKPADLIEDLSLHRHSSAKGVRRFFHLAGDKDHGSEAGVDQQGFKQSGKW